MSKKPKLNPHKVDADAYNEIVAKAVLRGIKLINSRFDMKPEALASDPKSRTYAVDYGLVAEQYEEENCRLYGVFQFTATCRFRRKKLLAVSGEYLVTYQVSGPCEAGAASLFVERLGPFAAYPYFRALFSLITGQAGLMTPPLPILAEAPRRIGRAESLQMKTGSPLLDQSGDAG